MRVPIQGIFTNNSDGCSIALINPHTIAARFHDILDRNNEGCQVLLSGYLSYEGVKKSPQQMGYYYAEVLPKALQGYKESGYYSFTEYDAHEDLKKMFFSESKINEKTGEIKIIPLSLADSDMHDLSRYISSCITFIEENFGILVDPPKYKIQ